MVAKHRFFQRALKNQLRQIAADRETRGNGDYKTLNYSQRPNETEV